MNIKVLNPHQHSQWFHQLMADRMEMSYLKYGPVEQGFPDKVDAIQTLKAKLLQYDETHNKEFLIDVANYAMIEFMFPRFKDAHYTPTDRSIGRLWHGEVDMSNRSNKGED